jgi:hypothetical protein
MEQIDWMPKTFEGRVFKFVWPYLDGQGKVIGYVVRYDSAKDPTDKVTIPFFKNGNAGGFRMGAHAEPKPLFGLESLARDTRGSVVIVEGEKCAAALQGLGIPAITWQGGAKAYRSADWTAIRGVKKCYLFPDNDAPGKDAMSGISRMLAEFENPPQCAIVDLPDLPEKGDVVDFLKGKFPSWDGYLPFEGECRGSAIQILRDVVKSSARAVPAIETIPCKAETELKLVVPLPMDQFMDRTATQRRAILGDWFLEKMPVLVSGEPGCGKSLFAYTVAVALASGGEAFGWRAGAPLKVGILDGEMFDVTIQKRLGGIVAGMNREFDPATIRLYTRDMCADGGTPFPSMRHPEEREPLLDKFGDVDVLIADNINALFPGGDERGTQFWSAIEQFLFDCRARGIAPMVIHHTTKTTPDSPAGSSKNVRVFEMSIVLTRIYEGRDGAHFNITFTKSRELSKEQAPRSAFAETSEKGALKWELADYVPPSDEDSGWASKARSARASGQSIRKIASALGKSTSTIHTMLKKEDVAT